jgi:thiol:disulfide interchange protein DsbC
MLKRTLMAILMIMSLPVMADEKADLQAQIQSHLPPTMLIESFEPAADSGLYEAVINGDILYFTADGRYVIQGDLVSLASRVNLTDVKLLSLRKNKLAQLDEKEMIIFAPKKTEYTLTVFTDIDCGYCRKLHSEIDQYLAEGIRIRYMFFPRAGLESESYDKAVTVWCQDDKQAAMTRAKRMEPMEMKTCENPVKAQYQIGRQLGVSGTPAMFMENGQSIPGYVPAKRLKQILQESLG